MSKHRPTPRWVRQSIFVLVALAVGGLGAVGLYKTRSRPQPQSVEDTGPLVRVQTAKRENVAVAVQGFGTVEPAVAVDIVPQVSGKVVGLHPSMVDGGYFKSGDVLIEIDPTDYQLAMEESTARLQEAEADQKAAAAGIDEAKAMADDAQIEVDYEKGLYDRGAATEREFGRATAELKRTNAALEASIAAHRRAGATQQLAQTRLKIAQVNLDRTRIAMPFDGRVMTESVDVGRQVVAGQTVATVYGTDVMEVVVPLEDRQLAWFDVPSENHRDKALHNPANGSAVEVTVDFAGRQLVHTGRIARTQGQIDTRSRMVRIVVQVPRPPVAGNGNDTLVPGMFASVKIFGHQLENVIALPRYAVHDASRVWTVVDGQLRMVSVQIARVDGKQAYVSVGLNEGDIIITSSLDIATDGMRVRLPEPAGPISEQVAGDG